MVVRVTDRSLPTSLRYYIGTLRQEHLLSVLQSRLESLSSVYNFKPLDIEPQRKDGGVFVRFSYTLPASEPLPDDSDPLSVLQNALNEEVGKIGGLPTWFGVRSGDFWVVKGSPWKEVCHLNLFSVKDF